MELIYFGEFVFFNEFEKRWFFRWIRGMGFWYFLFFKIGNVKKKLINIMYGI